VKKKIARKFKRPVLGDIFEVRWRGGRGYGHYVKRYSDPPVWGSLIRVLPGTFKTRPANFDDLVAQREQFVTFFPLGAAVARGLVKIVDHQPVPERFKEWPLFRACNRNAETGHKTWFLWDGEREWKVGDLKPEQYSLPLREVITLGILRERMKASWSPKDER
jgi:hypothetical protein